MRGKSRKRLGHAEKAVHDFYQLIRLTSATPGRRYDLEDAVISYGKIDETVCGEISLRFRTHCPPLKLFSVQCFLVSAERTNHFVRFRLGEN